MHNNSWVRLDVRQINNSNVCRRHVVSTQRWWMCDTMQCVLYLIRICTSLIYQMSSSYICLWPGSPRAGSCPGEKVFRAPQQWGTTLNLKDRIWVAEWRAWSERVNLYDRRVMILPRKTKEHMQNATGTACGMLKLIRGKEEGSVRRISIGGQMEGWLKGMKGKGVERKVRDG